MSNPVPPRPMPEPEHADPLRRPSLSSEANPAPNSETELARLAAVFAAHGGDGLPARVSADLALEIVLNEIVEEAALATRADGAAIALLRDGEMVCRASSGKNAPELGARLASDFGLTAECLKTKQPQLCNEAQVDPRADIEACLSLGVRSVMVFPLLRAGSPLGVLEVFSSRAGAFRERDEVALEVLAQDVLKNLEQASTPLAAEHSNSPASARPDMPTGEKAIPTASATGAKQNPAKEDVKDPHQVPARTANSQFDLATFAMAAAIVLCAILLGIFLGVGLGWRKTLATRSPAKSFSAAGQKTASVDNAQARGQRSNSVGSSEKIESAVIPSATISPDVTNSTVSASASKDAPVPHRTEIVAPNIAPNHSPAPVGSLLVYENGQEIFRLPPTGGTNKKGIQARTEAPSKSALTTAGIVDLSPEAAEGILLKRVAPEYPEQARQHGIQGPVVLDLHIGRDGTIQEVKAETGDPLLTEAALAAVKQWRFKPRLIQGHAVEMQTKVTLNFKLPS
ncbi:MAG: TonB family protein [Candidatus Sulfotelmatobacter sp.]